MYASSIIVLLLITLCNIDLTPAQFVIHHPPSIAGPYESLRSSFSAPIPPLESGITAIVALGTPCSTLNSSIVAGKIVVSIASSGNCLFWNQAQNVIAAGGLGLILWRDQPTLQPLLYTSTTSSVSIPTVSVSITVANSIIAAIRSDQTVNMTIGYTPAPAAQKQALLDFWNALSGSKWRFGSTGLYNEWKASTDPCSSWYGVTCNASTGDIRGISLPLNNLAGTIPASISALTELGQIQLTTNAGIKGPLPVEFFQFPRMRYLEASSCGLTGSIPEDIGTMTRLIWLKFDTNQMSGPLPVALATLTRLQILLLNGNKFTGPIPEDIGNLVNMTQMSFSKNSMSGTLPASLGNLIAVNRLELASNTFFGAMPSTLGQLTLMTFFDISYNAFEGSLPTQLSRLVSLGYLNVGSNKFSGPLPNFAGSKLLALDISHNNLSGTIVGTQLPTNLAILKASKNSFTALSGFASSIYLTYLDVSYNNLTSLASLKSLAKVTLDQVNTGISGLTFIDMSHNQMTNETMLFDSALGNFPSLLTMDLSYNLLGGTLTPPSDVSLSQNLQTLDYSNNQILGTIPEVFAQMPSLTSFNLVNNKLHHASGSLLPLFSTIDYTVLQDNITGNFYCPSFGATHSVNFKLSIDSGYHDFFKCICKEGYRRLPNTIMLMCERCPEHMICSGGKNDANYSFELNYWPTPSRESPQYMLPCPNCVFNDLERGSMCADGYTGRLCSQCDDGFYLSSGTKCNSCVPSGLLLFSVVILIVVGIIAGFTIIAIKFGNVVELAHTKSIELSTTNINAGNDHKFTTGNPVARAFAPPPSVPSKIFSRWKYFQKFSFDPSIAIINIIINYTQTLSILTRNLSLNYSFRQFISAIEIANISGTGFGVECVNALFVGMIPRYLFTSLQPLFVTGCALIAILIGVVVIKVMLHQNYKWWMIVCMRSWLFLVDFLFFPVVLNCIAYFKCTEDKGTGLSYLDEYPFAACDSVPQTYKFAFLFVNLFGVMLLFGAILWNYKSTKSKTRKMHIKAVFGFFFEQYKPHFFYVGLLWLTRRLLFSIINGLLHPHSLELYISNMVFITASVLIVFAARPFKRPVDNSYEIVSYVTLAFAYSILYVGYFAVDVGSYMVVFYFLANALLYLNFLVVLILSKFPSLSQIKSFVYCEWARARVERFDDSEE